MRIRPATTLDCAAIANIQITSYRTAYAGIMPDPYLAQFSHEEQTQDWHDLLTTAGADFVLVAELDPELDPEMSNGQVVGYALGRPRAVVDQPETGELVAMHVLAAHQRNGIGRQLFATVADDLRRSGSTGLILWTLAANPIRRWYEQLGGQLCAEQHLDINGVDVVEVAYAWADIDRLCVTLSPQSVTP